MISKFMKLKELDVVFSSSFQADRNRKQLINSELVETDQLVNDIDNPVARKKTSKER